MTQSFTLLFQCLWLTLDNFPPLIYAIAAVYLLLLPQVSLLPFFLGIKQYFECGRKSHCHFHFGDLLDGMEPHNSICEWPFFWPLTRESVSIRRINCKCGKSGKKSESQSDTITMVGVC